MPESRQYSFLDQLLINIDQGIQTLCSPSKFQRSSPAESIDESKLSEQQRKQAASLMRVNHAGEVSAQALYQGQALTAHLPDVREKMQQAANEESDHLAWCEQRIKELSSHTSYLNPVWYLGSFIIGATAGLIGDKWSLGFVAETERQVVAHLNKHLQQLPTADSKSKAILLQMQEDEAHHATVALEAGAAELPEPIKILMTITSKIMTQSAYYI